MSGIVCAVNRSTANSDPAGKRVSIVKGKVELLNGDGWLERCAGGFCIKSILLGNLRGNIIIDKVAGVLELAKFHHVGNNPKRLLF